MTNLGKGIKPSRVWRQFASKLSLGTSQGINRVGLTKNQQFSILECLQMSKNLCFSREFIIRQTIFYKKDTKILQGRLTPIFSIIKINCTTVKLFLRSGGAISQDYLHARIIVVVAQAQQAMMHLPVLLQIRSILLNE